jgi:hypothetical protein
MAKFQASSSYGLGWIRYSMVFFGKSLKDEGIFLIHFWKTYLHFNEKLKITGSWG